MDLEVVAGCNSNDRYMRCIPYFLDFWLAARTHLRIKPTVHLLADSIPEFLKQYEKHIVLHRPTEKVPSSLASQLIRILVAPYSSAKFVMLSDVDMIPLSQKVTEYGFRILKTESDFLMLRSDAVPASSGEVAICYNLASPSTWAKLLNHYAGQEPAKSSEQIFKDYISPSDFEDKHGGKGWNIDQKLLFDLISNSKDLNVVRVLDAETGHKRLDRALHRFPKNMLQLPGILRGEFTDYHAQHPVNDFRNYFFLSVLTFVQKMRNNHKR
jgi:hypothetical protein